jgi:hypothetical protein
MSLRVFLGPYRRWLAMVLLGSWMRKVASCSLLALPFIWAQHPFLWTGQIWKSSTPLSRSICSKSSDLTLQPLHVVPLTRLRVYKFLTDFVLEGQPSPRPQTPQIRVPIASREWAGPSGLPGNKYEMPTLHRIIMAPPPWGWGRMAF